MAALLRTLCALLCLAAVPAYAQSHCRGFGPQTPRDISNAVGTNARHFALAPSSYDLNLCNIHTHTNAEHKGPGFSVFAGSGEHGGYRCNETDDLRATDLEDHSGGHDAFHGVKPGDTIEVHWVYSSCDVGPGPGLGACLSPICANPQLRVEAQVFLVVSDPAALDFTDYAYGGEVNGLHQPKKLPGGTGSPVVFAGSTTGPSYTQEVCSPLQVT
ncbi:delta-class carbonic anhydrase [Primorskyibacter sp. 2E107]|uniref:delta-class carbonic anhydrase n=1 Tax=Primorskyibacter sp. 2E107 TaxID=3403458 RepID=UPI003AF5B68B